MNNQIKASMIDAVAQLSDAELLRWYEQCGLHLQELQERAGRMEQEILRRMEERGATAIPSDQFVCELKQGNSYDQTSLTPLLEIFNQLEISSCFQPPYEETVTVPAKWRIPQVIAAAKRRGTEALAIVARAKIAGVPRLVFKRRKEVYWDQPPSTGSLLVEG